MECSEYMLLFVNGDNEPRIHNILEHTTFCFCGVLQMYMYIMKSFIAMRVKRHFWHFESKGTIV